MLNRHHTQVRRSDRGDAAVLTARAGYCGKRAFDLLLLAVISLPAIPLCLACALAIYLDDGPPVLFRQERVGLYGARFRVMKFRTMFDGPDGNPLFPDPARITRVGRFLRRTSMDELPQLWNVLVGDMSLVGPRPTLAYQVERYDQAQRLRLNCRPGLTGLAQVRGRNSISWGERIAHDCEYVHRQSPLLDLRLLLLTARAVLSGSGAEGHPVDDPLARLEPVPRDRAVGNDLTKNSACQAGCG